MAEITMQDKLFTSKYFTLYILTFHSQKKYLYLGMAYPSSYYTTGFQSKKLSMQLLWYISVSPNLKDFDLREFWVILIFHTIFFNLFFTEKLKIMDILSKTKELV